MARAISPGVTIERLLDHLADGTPDHPLIDELGRWLAASPRFRAFVERNRDRIRKKLRGTTDADARRDVRAELRVAYLLLEDRRIELMFEAYGSTKGGPDFSIAYRGEQSFNLEVTRRRLASSPTADGGALLAKLRQLPPSVPNVVVMAVEGESAAAFDIAAATRALRARADAKDEAFFIGRGFDGTRGFYQRYLRLSAVLVWCEMADGDARVTSWINRSARIGLPDRAARACIQCLRED